MAAIRWTFPDGAHSDVLTAPLAGADSSNFSGGTATLSSDHVLAGMNTLSAQCINTGTGHLWFAKDGLSATSYAYDIYLYMTTRTGGNLYIGWAGACSSARSLGLQIGGSQNRVALADSTGQIWQSDGEAFPDNTWIRFSLFGTCDPAVGTGRVAWFAGHSTSPMGDSGLLTDLDTGASIDRIRIGGKAASSAVATGEVYIGSWAYDTVASDLIPPFGTPTPSGVWHQRSGGGWSPVTAQRRDTGAWQPVATQVQ